MMNQVKERISNLFEFFTYEVIQVEILWKCHPNEKCIEKKGKKLATNEENGKRKNAYYDIMETTGKFRRLYYENH